MIGKCIRKKDGKVLQYKLLRKTTTNVFYTFDPTWRLLGDQQTFEKEYIFENEIDVAIIFHDLHFGVATLGGGNYLKLLHNNTPVTF